MTTGEHEHEPAHLVGDAEVVRVAFDELPVLVAVTEGPEHRFVAANAGYRALVGRSDLLGRRLRDALPEVEGQRVFERFDQVYATGETLDAHEWRLQIDTDRTGTPRDLYLNFQVLPRRTPDGDVHGLLFAIEDVTESVHRRRVAEREAAEAQRRYQEARDVVTELQQALLPQSLPTLPGARVAARYLVAAEDQSTGGDWFDAIPLADGRVALVVGDVVGHGVVASAAMGQMRAVLNHLILTEPALTTVLDRADQFATSVPTLHAVTVAVVVLDQATGELTYALCGHPAPLLVAGDGTYRYLPATGAGPLATGSPGQPAHATLAAGETVLLYSDGLIERPGATLQDGMTELASIASDAAARRAFPIGAASTAAERVCQLTVELLTRDGYSDDVTALAAQLLPETVTPLALTLPSNYDSLPEVRDAFTTWLDRFEVLENDRIALELAASEAVTNAIEHAYSGRSGGTVSFEAELRPDGYLECRISDQGSWREPAGGASTRGRGLMLMEQMLDELRVQHLPQPAHEDRGSRGTVVTLRHRLHRPAMLASDTVAKPAAASTVPFEAEPRPDGSTVHVQGPVDVTTAEKFRRALISASRGGVRVLTVDLCDVTHLASAGVGALHEIREQLQGNGQRLRLLAPPASAAQIVLDLVRLPCEPESPESH